MKFTKESLNINSFFINNDCISTKKMTKKTSQLLLHLYNQIKDGVSYVNQNVVIKPQIKEISNSRQIPRPTTFPSDAINISIRNHINKHIINSISYSFDLFAERKVRFIFCLECEVTNKVIKQYNNYAKHLLVWIHIIDHYASKSCSRDFTAYIYHTSLLKTVPDSSSTTLNEYHVNTAFTTTCPAKSEIVLYRKEEWFKVFIHETFHNFGLDFSGPEINLSSCHSKILELFPVRSRVNLYESYTEFWARLINIVFCTYFHTKDVDNEQIFLSNVSYLITIEQKFALFQMVKVLQFMDLDYYELQSSDAMAKYKEDSNVLSYFIITSILLYNYQNLLVWCDNNNDMILCFKKTSENLNKYCSFIESHYRSSSFVKSIDCVEDVLTLLKEDKLTKQTKYLINNMRMTSCELG
jgi:hypothetical protein